MRNKLLCDDDFAWKKWLWVGYTLFAVALFTKTGFSGAIMALSAGLVIVCYRVQSRRWQPLRSSWFLFVGSISYSIYLWHLLVIFCLQSGLQGTYDHIPGLPNFLIVVAITVLVSVVSYLMVERPTNSLGYRIANTLELRAGRGAAG